MRDSHKGLIAIIIVNFIWGIDFIAIEYMMDYMSPAMFTFARVSCSCVMLVLAMAITGRKLKIAREDWLRIFISGAVGMSLYFTVENAGTGLTSASFSAMIMAMVPVFGLISDAIFFGNRITPVKVICVLASIAGVYLLVSGEPMGLNMKGLLLMLLAALLWSFYIVYVKPLYDRYDLLTLLTALFISGFIVQTPITLLTGDGVSLAGLETRHYVIIVLTAMVCILLGEFGYMYSIGKLSVTMVSIFENVLPLTTVILSFIIFKVMLTPMQIIGGLAIMISVTILAIKE